MLLAVLAAVACVLAAMAVWAYVDLRRSVARERAAWVDERGRLMQAALSPVNPGGATAFRMGPPSGAGAREAVTKITPLGL